MNIFIEGIERNDAHLLNELICLGCTLLGSDEKQDYANALAAWHKAYTTMCRGESDA